MNLPLLAHWRIRADELPDRLLDMERPAPVFTLPGASALRGFAGLLGEAEDNEDLPAQDAQTETEDAPFPLPAMLPNDVTGDAELFLEIDFGALTGDRAVLAIDEIAGSGDILLGGEVIARFGAQSHADASDAAARLTAIPCMLAVDLTDALRRGRKETLAVRFGAARPAGIPGPVFLHMSSVGWLSELAILPDAAAGTMAVRTRIHASREGRYILRVSPQPARPGEPLPPAREMHCMLNPLESRECAMTLAVSGSAFVPGTPADLTALRAELLYMEGRTAVPCDGVLAAAGYPGRAAASFVPLQAQDMRGDCESLIARLTAQHICAVSLPAPAADCFYLAAARAGVSVCHIMPQDHPSAARLTRHPNFCALAAPPAQQALTLEETAWQMCGVPGAVRQCDPGFTPAELLLDAAGRRLDPADDSVHNVLVWLSAVAVRLRAEAARQQRCSGALCAPGQWTEPDAADALKTALAPCHLSALPLLGAWWTGTRFSAALEAFASEADIEKYGTMIACAVLEDDAGKELARVRRPFRPRSGGAPLGVIEAMLPEEPCVLTLTCRLLSGDQVLDENTLPVYVGLRGPLEAAF